jgi:hypothetical protein
MRNDADYLHGHNIFIENKNEIINEFKDKI